MNEEQYEGNTRTSKGERMINRNIVTADDAREKFTTGGENRKQFK